MAEASAEELLNAAIGISEAAAAIPRRYFHAGISVEDKPDESPVTIADRETEAFIRREIEARFPDHGILGEEFGRKEARGDVTWIIDPIDGTKAFISGYPTFGMLIGAMRGDRMAAGVINMPALHEYVGGASGVGAMRNGAPVACRARPLADAIIFINGADRLLAQRPDSFARLMRVGKLRRFSYDCYPFALVATGEIDAVVDFDLQPYDYLAPAAVVEAAGGVITDWRGGPLGLDSDGAVLAAGDAALHAELLGLLG
jgi:histidinol phosphatase-like enzyme (inositol monophosphatase family)